MDVVYCILNYDERDSSMAEKINYENLDGLVYKRIKNMILSNELERGTKIVQNELAEELGVSRTPIRRALSQLAKEHLVEVSQRGLAYVRDFSRKEMTTIFEIREVLEGLACRKAAQTVNKEKLGHYKGVYREAMESITGDDWRAYQEADVKFHFFVIEASGVRLLEDMVKSFRILSSSFIPGLVRSPQETFREHIAIIDALGRSDAEGAENLMREHLRRSRDALERAYLEKGTDLRKQSKHMSDML